ncbi:hypothetical protein [Myxacorys almedinensis]|uniref:Uncharacterized protein n=1 Tax=Myxacorys almedinensis A TaxID=2690445 RepID=A0A8J8CJK7_9CYAN|nr:hypothetical protein [Myxacorys almedinensis]NDJ18769.1 hypothetical protein [Myxacorys almedinensis A]
MRNAFIQILVGLSASCLSLATTTGVAQAQPVNSRFTGYTGSIANVPVVFEKGGKLEFAATSTNGDVDIFVYNSAGRLVGSGKRVGNELIGGNLPAGRYSVRLRMAKCPSVVKPCDANLAISRDGKPIRFERNPGTTSSSGLDPFCVKYGTARGFNQATAEGLCRRIDKLRK